MTELETVAAERDRFQDKRTWLSRERLVRGRDIMDVAVVAFGWGFILGVVLMAFGGR